MLGKTDEAKVTKFNDQINSASMIHQTASILAISVLPLDCGPRLLLGASEILMFADMLCWLQYLESKAL